MKSASAKARLFASIVKKSGRATVPEEHTALRGELGALVQEHPDEPDFAPFLTHGLRQEAFVAMLGRASMRRGALLDEMRTIAIAPRTSSRCRQTLPRSFSNYRSMPAP